MASTAAIVLHMAAQETAGGVGAAVDLVQRLSVDVTLLVTAGSGILNVSLETSESGAGGWVPLASFAMVSEPGSWKLTVPGCSRFVRASWDLSAAFTFSVAGVAVLVYCTPADVRNNSLHAKALAQVVDADVDEIARKQTAVANSYLRKHPAITLPLLHWGDDLRSKVCDLVAYQVLKRRGINPESTDQIVVDAKDDAIKWLMMVASGKVTPDEVVDSTHVEPGPFEDLTAYAYSDRRRGV